MAEHSSHAHAPAITTNFWCGIAFHDCLHLADTTSRHSNKQWLSLAAAFGQPLMSTMVNAETLTCDSSKASEDPKVKGPKP